MRFLPIDDGHDAMTMRLAAVPRGHGKELRTEQTRRFVCTGEQTSTFTPLVCENQIVLVLPLSLSLSVSLQGSDCRALSLLVVVGGRTVHFIPLVRLCILGDS